MKREDFYGDTDKLLFDILQELKILNGKNVVKQEVEEENKQYPCKACGGAHENKGQMLACARKKKKEGAK